MDNKTRIIRVTKKGRRLYLWCHGWIGLATAFVHIISLGYVSRGLELWHALSFGVVKSRISSGPHGNDDEICTSCYNHPDYCTCKEKG